MGVPTSEVCYIPAMPRREDHEVHKGHVVALEEKKKHIYALFDVSLLNCVKCQEYLCSLGGLNAIYDQAFWITSVSVCLFHAKPFTRSGFCSWKVKWRSVSHASSITLDVSESFLPVGKDCALCVCFSPMFWLRRNETGWN